MSFLQFWAYWREARGPSANSNEALDEAFARVAVP